MKAYGFIYITTNTVNGNRYIGQCSYVRNKRWQTYLGSGKHLQTSIKKHGKENFEREILCNAFTKDDLDYLETHFISEFNAVEDRTFYNITKGATSTGGFRNKKHTDETKLKMSTNCQNRVITDKLRKSSAGNIQKALLAQSNNPKFQNERNTRIKEIGLKNKGKKASAETRAKLSAAGLARAPYTEETKYKMSESKKKIWEILNLETNQLTITRELEEFCITSNIDYKKLLFSFYRKSSSQNFKILKNYKPAIIVTTMA